MREKGGKHWVPGPGYMVDALKLPNEAPIVSGESLQIMCHYKLCMTWRCPDGTQHLFCWPLLAISGQSLASNGTVVDSRDLNLVFDRTKATHNKLVLSCLTKYTVEPSWPLVLWQSDRSIDKPTIWFTRHVDIDDLSRDGLLSQRTKDPRRPSIRNYWGRKRGPPGLEDDDQEKELRGHRQDGMGVCRAAATVVDLGRYK
ncbi:hypothetical protein TNCV_4272201 [Trichonephila clavipes]|nr:hypothetical protein TNCV_4272201 [Trichonephila clavipes]